MTLFTPYEGWAINLKKKPKSFKNKLLIYFMLFAAVIFSVLWLLQTVFLQSFYNRMLIDNTKKAAQSIRENSECENITSIIDSVSWDNSVLVFVTDENGKVLYFSDEFKGAGQKNHNVANLNGEHNDNGIKNKHVNGFRNLPEEYGEFLERLTDSGEDTIEYSNDNIYVYGTYIDYYNSESKAILYVSTTLDPVGSAVTIIRFQLVWVTALSLIVGFVFAWFIAKSFGKPVAQLSEKANRLGEQDYPESFEKGFCSELDELSKKLDSTSEKLIETRAFQTELLANVSHDLRTPLTMIKGYAEIIADTSWDDEEQCRADVAVIVRETDRLTSLVNEILEYSELKTGEVPHEFVRVDLSALTKKVCKSFEELYKGKEENIETNIQDSVFVNGISGRLERAVYNLIDNAFRYTDNSRTVTVRLSATDTAVKIEVTDYGSGIPETEIEHIWDRYYTFRQRKGKGVSGLGLAIVKQTVEMHGGKCYAESTLGKGSTFVIELERCK